MTKWMRRTLFARTDRTSLCHFPYHGKLIRVTIFLTSEEGLGATGTEPDVLLREEGEGSVEEAMNDPCGGPYTVAHMALNGQAINVNDWIDDSDLSAQPHVNEWHITLSSAETENMSQPVKMNLMGFDRNLHFAPPEPTLRVFVGKEGAIELEMCGGNNSAGGDLQSKIASFAVLFFSDLISSMSDGTQLHIGSIEMACCTLRMWVLTGLTPLI